MPSCKDEILSQDYADFIVEYGGNPNNISLIYGTDCIQIFNDRYAAFHLPLSSMEDALERFSYNAIPKLFALMDTSSMDISGITRLHRQPYLNLLGEDIIVGIIDTGIDYKLPAFRRSDGATRIVRIWDQAQQKENASTGSVPNADAFAGSDSNEDTSIDYGVVYTKEMIDEALLSDNPEAIVPVSDTAGHGTFLAAVAAGSVDEAGDFTGAAPMAEIAVVKLKPAKAYLRDYYRILNGAEAYQENDIMAGVSYLLALARELNKPVSICIGLGTNSGDHSGGSYISRFLDMAATLPGVCITCAAGNEADRACHFYGKLDENQPYSEVELRVGENEAGFVTELWSQAPDLFEVGFVSPGGEVVDRITPKAGGFQRISFFIEPSVIEINYKLSETAAFGEVVLMRFINPVPGVWRIRIYGSSLISGDFHLWLPVQGFVGEDTAFLMPNPDNTVTVPADAAYVLSIGAYNHYNNSIYLYSGRGFTPAGRVVPDLCAPGVNVYVPSVSGRYTVRSGTSIAAAHGCGAAALLLEWGIFRQGDYTMSTTQVRQYLIRGAKRQSDILYPSRLWGYGILDAYRAFEIFIQ